MLEFDVTVPRFNDDAGQYLYELIPVMTVWFREGSIGTRDIPWKWQGTGLDGCVPVLGIK